MTAVTEFVVYEGKSHYSPKHLTVTEAILPWVKNVHLPTSPSGYQFHLRIPKNSIYTPFKHLETASRPPSTPRFPSFEGTAGFQRSFRPFVLTTKLKKTWMHLDIYKFA